MTAGVPMALALLVACGAGPDPETLVDELRIIAVVPEPPEVTTGDTTAVTVTVADPVGDGADLLIWGCTDLGDGCLEIAISDDVSGAQPQVEERDEDQQGATVDFTVPAEMAFLLAELGADGTLPITGLWALACAPDLCPPMDRARAGELGSGELADPSQWLESLPLEGVSLARKTLTLSARDPDQRHTNPLIERVGDSPITAAPGASMKLTMALEGSFKGGEVFGYATAGGFDAASGPAAEGEVELRWFAPEDGKDGDEVDLYIVVSDGLGGQAVWTGQATVGG